MNMVIRRGFDGPVVQSRALPQGTTPLGVTVLPRLGNTDGIIRMRAVEGNGDVAEMEFRFRGEIIGMQVGGDWETDGHSVVVTVIPWDGVDPVVYRAQFEV